MSQGKQASAGWELVYEEAQHEANLHMQLAQRVHDRTPLWKQYLGGTLEVHVHALWDGMPLCVKLTANKVFGELENARHAHVYIHRQHVPVFGGVVEVAKDARPLRSFERLELAEDCDVFVREAFEEARAPSREALRCVLDGKLRASLRGSRVVLREDVNEIIQRDPQVVDDLADQDACINLKGTEDYAAWPPDAAIRVYLGDYAVLAQLPDLLENCVQIRQVFTCPTMPAVGAVERYLGGDLSLEELALLVGGITWDKPDAPVLAHAVEHTIDEAASGAMTRAEMNERLAQLVKQPAFA